MTKRHPDVSMHSLAQVDRPRSRRGQGSGTQALHPEPYPESLERLYAWENDDDVRQYLRAHPETHRPLLQAAAIVPEHFGSGTQLTLKVVPARDGDGSYELFAFIHTDQAPLVALENLDRFDASWWLGVVPSVNGALSFALRFA